jgi:hypothetical protein
MAKIMYIAKFYNMHISTIHKETFSSSQCIDGSTSKFKITVGEVVSRVSLTRNDPILNAV